MGVLAYVLLAGWRLGHKLPGFCWPEALVDEESPGCFDFGVTGCADCSRRDVLEWGWVVLVVGQEFEHGRDRPFGSELV